MIFMDNRKRMGIITAIETAMEMDANIRDISSRNGGA